MTDILLDKGDKQGKLRTEFVTGEGGGAPLYGLYGDVLLERAWIFASLS